MLILFLAGFGVFCDVFTGSQADTACYGGTIKLPSFLFSPTVSVFFIPSNGGPEKLVINNRKPMDPRIKRYHKSFYLTNLTREDEGYFSYQRSHSLRFKISVSDCVEKCYMDELEYKVSTEAQYLEFTPQIDSNKPIILWSRADLQGNDERRGTIMNNVWRISSLTQADRGYYSFRQHDSALESRVHLTVKENSSNNDTNQNNHTTITYPRGFGSWSDTMWPTKKNEHETVLTEDNQSWENNSLFNAQSYDVEYYTVPQSWDSSGPKKLLKFLKFISIGLGIFLILCYCCKRCLACNSKNSSAFQTEVLVVSYPNENSPTGQIYSAPACSPVFSDQPDGVTMNPPRPGVTVNPPQPGITVNPPHPGITVNSPHPGITVNSPHPGITVNSPHPSITMNPPQPGITMNPPQPGITMNPPQPGITMNPPKPGITVNPPQPVTVNPTHPGISVKPTHPAITVNPPHPDITVNSAHPGITMNPPQPCVNVNPPQPGITVNSPQPGINVLQPEVTPPLDLGSAAAPTFSLDFLSSGDKSRFELSLTTDSLLRSETPSCAVYDSEKLNFL